MTSPNPFKSILTSLMSEHNISGDVHDFYLISFSYLLEGVSLVLEGFHTELSIKLIDLFVLSQSKYFQKSDNLTLVCFGPNSRRISKIPNLTPIWTPDDPLPLRCPILEVLFENLEELSVVHNKITDILKHFSITLVLYNLLEISSIKFPDDWQIIVIATCESPYNEMENFVKIVKIDEVIKIERIENTSVEATSKQVEIQPVPSVPLDSNINILLTSLLKSNLNMVIQHLPTVMSCVVYLEHIFSTVDIEIKKLQVVVHGDSPSISLLYKQFIDMNTRKIITFYFTGGDLCLLNTYLVNTNIQLLFISTEHLHSSLRIYPTLLKHCQLIMALAIDEINSKLVVHQLMEVHRNTQISTQCVVIATGDVMNVECFIGKPFYHFQPAQDTESVVDVYH